MASRARKLPPPASLQAPEAPRPAPIVPQRMQRALLASPADVAIGGGSAGSGKTFALLLEPLRHARVPGFGAVIFRRTYPEITNEGGLWDESARIYPRLGAAPKVGDLTWAFPGGASVTFAHMQHEQDRLTWAGAQIPLIGFDQLELFTEAQFWFMWSRNRSTCGVAPYIRATCNPVPDDDPTGGWLRRMIDWWIGPDGYPVEARAGALRWFARVAEKLEWGDSREEVVARTGVRPSDVLSMTFVPGKLEDNPALTSADPAYEAKLNALPHVDRMRLRHGNWNVRPQSGNVFNRAWFELVDAAPREARRGRGWDKAGTAGGGDASAGVKLAEWKGVWYVEHAVVGRWSSGARNDVIDQTAEFDGPGCVVVVEQEPGSGGKESAEISVRRLAGREVHAVRVTGSKLTRAKELAAQAEHGNVKVVRGPWAQAFVEEAHRFTGADGGVDDQVDAASVIFNYMALHPDAVQIW